MATLSCASAFRLASILPHSLRKAGVDAVLIQTCIVVSGQLVTAKGKLSNAKAHHEALLLGEGSRGELSAAPECWLRVEVLGCGCCAVLVLCVHLPCQALRGDGQGLHAA